MQLGTTITFRTFSSFPKEDSHPLAVTPHFPFSSTLGKHLQTLFLWICYSDISYKWINEIIQCVAFVHDFFTSHVFKVHPCYNMYPNFTFYCQIIFDCMDIPYLFIHSSIDDHLGLFHVLAAVNNATVNICLQVFLCGPMLYLSWVKT